MRRVGTEEGEKGKVRKDEPVYGYEARLHLEGSCCSFQVVHARVDSGRECSRCSTLTFLRYPDHAVVVS